MTAEFDRRFDRTAATASVVIPAHDEARVIDRCLQALHAIAPPGESTPLDVVVVANGCSDDTAHVARRHPGVTVLDLPTGSKRLALNAGDAVATAFPRIYLDADIVLDPAALAGLVAGLSTPEPVVASPHLRFVTQGATWPVRAFYATYARLPYVADGLIGLGVYGLSRAGRDRFGDFPDVAGDDLFVQRLFAPSERLITPGEFHVRVPRDLGNLVKVRTRVARGTAELAAAALAEEGDFSRTRGRTARALARLVRTEPHLAPAAAVYVAVGLAAHARARRPDTATWQRDDSTR